MKLISGSFLKATVLFCAVSAGSAFATTTTNNLGSLPGTTVLTGTLASEADVQLEDFTLSMPETLTIFSTSYAGGTNLDGTVTSAGGFQPNIALFTPSGFTVAQTTGSYPGNAGDPTTGIVGDSYFTSSLAAGSYVLSITNWGTTGDPVSGFTDSYGTGSFDDVGGNPRTGNYTVDVAQTPEPASFWLTLPVVIGMFAILRKRRTNVLN